jgi:hypothetical protein
MNRETIYASVFAFFSALTAGGSPLFKSATRSLTTWESVSPDDSPALLTRQRAEQADRKKGFPTKWTLHMDLFLYAHTGANNDPSIIPAQVLNPLLDAIEASLAIDDQSNAACTLGGLVSHCAINGTVEIYQGNLGDEAVAIVPIEILVISG